MRKSYSHLALFLCCLALFLSPLCAIVEQLCPNSCSGHGVCRPSVAGSCQCFPGYIGVDCSLRLCPSGKAWVDLPSADDIAHAEYAECSNMGTCDRSTGLCRCREGFTGAACDMSECPGPCVFIYIYTYSY
ncbi:hypothetical protein EON63_23860 [archaeon]|nr:MAG: hypothetical protein EON63_23860 [archaeon]